MFGPSEEGILESQIPTDPQGAIRDYLSEYRNAHRNCKDPFPGITDTLALLRSRGVNTAIVTGKGAGSAAISLEEMKLADCFEIVKAGSSAGASKPAAMRRVLSSWSLTPEHVAGVGDAASDIRAARQVGITAVAAAWSPTARVEVLNALTPDQLFDDVAQFHSWIGAQTINMQSP